MTSDRNFDPVFEKFQRRIKNSDKGRLRGILIREDLETYVPGFRERSLEVLDAGAGLGDMSLWLAEAGHQVTARDISSKMVAHTTELAAQKGLSHRVNAAVGSAQDALSEGRSYDLICMHAVLEWLVEPYAIPKLLKNSLKEGGMISLTFYNLHRSVFNSLIKGSFRRVLKGDFSGSSNPLTPPSPVLPERLLEELAAADFVTTFHGGLRCFYDYVPDKKTLEEHRFEDLLTLERRYRTQAPYRDIARYVHIIARYQPEALPKTAKNS